MAQQAIYETLIRIGGKADASLGKATKGSIAKLNQLRAAAIGAVSFMGASVVGQQIKKGIEKAAELQQLQTSLEVLLGSAAKAAAMQKELVKYGTATPYDTAGLAETAKLMLSFGINSEKVIPFMRAIGDVAMGDAQKMQGLSLAFSQMSSVGKLMGQDFLQMVNAGFNPLEEISRKTGKSIGKLKEEMSKGKITAQMVQDAFISASSAGGKYYQMALKQSKTFSGLMSTYSDAVDTTLGEAFKEILPQLQEILGKIIDFIPQLAPALKAFVSALSFTISRAMDLYNIFVGIGNFLKNNAGWITFIGTLVALRKGFMAVSAAVEFYRYQQLLATMAMLNGAATTPIMLLAQGKLIPAFTLLTANIWNSVKAIWAQTAALLANPWTWIAVGVAAVVTVIVQVIRHWKELTAIWSSSMGLIQKLTQSLKVMFGFGKSAENLNSNAQNIAHNALGTNYFSGGLTELSEKGSEVVSLPSGTKIFSHNRSNGMAYGSGGGVSVMINIAGNADGDTIRAAAGEAFTDFERKYDAMMRRRQRLGIA